MKPLDLSRSANADAGNEPVLTRAITSDGVPTIVIGLPQALIENMQAGLTTNFSLAGLGIQFSVMMFVGDNRERIIEQFVLLTRPQDEEPKQ